ncbi:ATP-binding cassette domain-containing protein [Caldiplasma sukawensis]
MIEIKGMSCSYYRDDKGNVLENINLSINGNRIVIVGSNGSGKTSLLKACLGFMKISSGYIKINGIDLNEGKKIKHISTNLMEVYKLLNLRISEIIEIYSEIMGNKKEVFFDMIKKFSLTEILDKKIYSLSTGQSKMFGNIMALSSGSKTILLDEPFEAVDQSRKLLLLKMINSFDGEILMNTHEFNIIKSLTDWTLYFLMDKHLYGPFETSDLNNLFLSKGNVQDAISVIELPYGTFSITKGSGEIQLSSIYSIEQLYEVINR